ncbi:MAG: TAXI family TRAP transporter solute-binding subunit [Alphaproteobacteria bacterium]|nr:TAXI family TRAP transporter solute-binding subunit [Alphaproteobacteria bacterium]
MKRGFAATLALLVALASATGAAQAQTRVTLKSATAGSSYYLMMVQLGEALKTASSGDLSPTIEESQGSVQNVKEAARRPGNFVFTTPPGLVRDAREGKAPFAGESGHDALRALFPIPGITMHWVVRADAGVASLSDLAGKDFIPGGRGTAGQRLTAAALTALGLEGKVRLVDTELGSAPAAVRNRQVAGYGTASTHPSPQVQELAATTAIRLIGLSPDEMEKVRAIDPSSAPVTIARGTYPGVDQDVRTLSVPVAAYATTRMDEATAFAITRAYWTQREAMARQNPWWAGVTHEMLAAVAGPLHPGALRYYAEAGIAVPEGLR